MQFLNGTNVVLALLGFVVGSRLTAGGSDEQTSGLLTAGGLVLANMSFPQVGQTVQQIPVIGDQVIPTLDNALSGNLNLGLGGGSGNGGGSGSGSGGGAAGGA